MCALKLDKGRVLLEVECQEDGISDVELQFAEIRLSLVRFEATECCDVWLVLDSIDEGVGSLLTQVVAEYTVNRGGCRQVSSGRDSKGWVGGSVLDARKRLIDGECTRQMFGSLFPQ